MLARQAIEYGAIFAARGARYEQAMCRHPQARALEFATMVRHLDVQDGETVVDAHAGGAYLRAYLPRSVTYIAIEESAAFQQACRSRLETGDRVELSTDSRMPLPAASCDRIASLTGLHHVLDRRDTYAEFLRVLRPGGRLVIADVDESTPVARFLNGFVDRHSSAGHVGWFLTDRDVDLLEEVGFTATTSAHVDYPWRFRDADEAADFCAELFGLDHPEARRALPRVLRDDLGGGMGPKGEWELPWTLRYLVSEAPV